MADEELTTGEITAQHVQTNLDRDWSDETFPTSAKSVFLWAGLMFGGIAAICLYVYFTSVKEFVPVAQDSTSDSKRATVQEDVKSITSDSDEEE